MAIRRGHVAMLEHLLNHGADLSRVGYLADREAPNETILNAMLNDFKNEGWGDFTDEEGWVDYDDDDVRPPTVVNLYLKRSMCLSLGNFAQYPYLGNRNTMGFLKRTLHHVIETGEAFDDRWAEPPVEADTEQCMFLFSDGGLDKAHALYHASHKDKLDWCRFLVVEHYTYLNPFLLLNDESNDTMEATASAMSPFHASAHHEGTSILDYFMELWDKRFSANKSYKDDNGDLALHVLCRDGQVSLPDIQNVVQRQPFALSMLGGAFGVGDDDNEYSVFPCRIFPLHAAAIADPKLDVIFYFLQRNPDALRRSRHPTTPQGLSPSFVRTMSH